MAAANIVLVSCDGVEFELERPAASLSNTIRNMIEDDCANHPIPIAKVDSAILARITEYCKKAAAIGKDGRALKAWNDEFLKSVKDDQLLMLRLISAVDFLDIKSLQDLLCREVAEQMSGQSIEAIRKLFHIENDFTKEEEEQISKEIGWALM